MLLRAECLRLKNLALRENFRPGIMFAPVQEKLSHALIPSFQGRILRLILEFATFRLIYRLYRQQFKQSRHLGGFLFVFWRVLFDPD